MAGSPRKRARRELTAKGEPIPPELVAGNHPGVRKKFSEMSESELAALIEDRETRRLMRLEIKRRVERAGQEALADAMKAVAPEVAAQDERIAALTTQVVESLEDAIVQGDHETIRALESFAKTLFAERKDFKDRFFGPIVQKSQNQNLNLNAAVELTDLPHLNKGNA